MSEAINAIRALDEALDVLSRAHAEAPLDNEMFEDLLAKINEVASAAAVSRVRTVALASDRGMSSRSIAKVIGGSSSTVKEWVRRGRTASDDQAASSK